MEYEWDTEKASANFAKHAVAFTDMVAFSWRTAIVFNDTRQDYSEARIIALGMINNRLHVCVYTGRGNKRRIISLRKANKREELVYEKTHKTTH